VHAKYLLVNDCCYWQTIKTVCEGLPKFDAVSSFAFVIETVDTINGSTFVISSEDKEIFRVFDLVGEQQTYCLKTLFSSINIISQEKVIGIWWKPSVFEQTEKIVVLTVNITANLYRGFKFEKYGLTYEDFSSFHAKLTDFLLGESHLFAGAGAADF
jgi:hypothetical protein